MAASRSARAPCNRGGCRRRVAQVRWLSPNHRLLTLADAEEKLETWRRYYNEERPHGVIGNKVPIMLQNPDGAAGPPS
ncbi:MAG: integrase core domain-containing protein [Proteobacteria bacterium]|nr:integrase core domain-containing protein [Pseudomonadota bacterium]